MEPLQLPGYPTGATIYVFPTSQSLADWTTYRVLMVEGEDDDSGLYTANVDPANGTEWLAFVGSSQPTWADAILGVVFSIENSAEVVAAIKADSVLGTAGMVADAATAATQSSAAAASAATAVAQTTAAAIKSGVRLALSGILTWTIVTDTTGQLVVTQGIIDG